jgi:MEDS: MEthanogen/methylotroph, DcmR Sensory domain
MCAECTDRRTISLGFTQERVKEGLHMCYLYNDETERRRVMSKFVESGILAKEKSLYIVDLMSPEEMLDCLEEQGVDARAESANVTILEALSVYRSTGVFNPNGMLDTLRDFYLHAVEKEGCSGARATGEASWCLADGWEDEATFMEYESRLNNFVSQVPATILCQYDTRRLSGKVIMDILNTHPVMIVHGQLVKNPFYIEPDVFLKEYQAQAGN